MQVIELAETMQLICKRLISAEAKTIRLIPTMGSLHAGHASLIKCAIEDEEVGEDCAPPKPAVSREAVDDKRSATSAPSGSASKRAVIVVSIFVNPLQFNDRDDFVKYPVSTEQDLALCKRLNVDYVFLPKRRELLGESYGLAGRKISTCSLGSGEPAYSTRAGSSTLVTIRPPDGLAQDLEGRARPNHFEGMMTIVCKLLNIVQPSRAYFGEKDYQQLVLVDKMVGDLNMVTRIRAVETVREPGSMLPLSSRNGRLTSEQRMAAASLMHGALVDGKHSLEDKCRRSPYDDSNAGPVPNVELETLLMASLVMAQSCSLTVANGDEDAISVDYFELRCAKDLSVIEFDLELNLYDCQNGCVKKKALQQDVDGAHANGEAKILDARLLIAVLIGRVRLLDNMAVRLNL